MSHGYTCKGNGRAIRYIIFDNNLVRYTLFDGKKHQKKCSSKEDANSFVEQLISDL